MQGIREGFRIGFAGEAKGWQWCPTQNMQSARDQLKVVDEYLAEECSTGRVAGPLQPDLFPQVPSNRFGVIPKDRAGQENGG